MASGYIGHFKGLLINPQSALISLKQASLRSAFFYFLFVWSVFAVLFCLIGGQLNLFHTSPDILYLVTFVMIVFIGWLYFGLVIHVVLRIVSGPKSVVKTYKAVFYAATPLAVIGWISFIGGLSFIWGLLLIRQGIVEYHEISKRTAISVIILSLFIGIPTFGMAYFFLPVAVSLIIH